VHKEISVAANIVTVNPPIRRVAKRSVQTRLFAIATTLTILGVNANAEPLSPKVSFQGFGTLGAVHSDENSADVVSNNFLQPNGAGHTSAWHMGVDSKLGGQMNVQIGEKLSATLQVVAQHRYDNSYTPQVEWANIKYQLTPDLSVRVGRTVLAAFMVSDTRLVGFANPWIRPPQEVYGIVPITNLDGIETSYTFYPAGIPNTLQLSAGRTAFKIPGGGKITPSPLWNVSNTVEYESWTFRVGYVSARLDFESPDLDPLFDGFTQFGNGVTAIPGLAATGAQAHSLVNRYQAADTPISVISVGARYDPGDWLLMAEWARISDSAMLPETDGWYVTGGYRFGNITPYLTIAEVNATTPAESGIATAGLPAPLAQGAAALNGGLNLALAASAPSQQSISVGVRWDFITSAAAKLQYEHLRLDAASSGRFGNVQPDFRPGGEANVLSFAVDFVF
jgi:hypothetical protein